MCEGTKPISNAGKELAALGKGYAPSDQIKLSEPIQNPETGSTEDNSRGMRLILAALILIVVVTIIGIMLYVLRRRRNR
ncbi:hypothetical protein [Paenibacillus sp. GCM10028914]|uniref:hypothetical protein n=1 Tax=Paenibacillus sp. GCM10028914 TaxID=3273416 RepID=UPI00361CCD24